MPIGDQVGKADWKKEKHVPVIDCADKVKADEMFEVKLTIGKEIPHPNTSAHHISWVALYFHPDGEKFSYLIARTEFSAHGASTEGPDTSSVYTHSSAANWMKTKKSGTLHSVSYCNIHGLWESEKKITIG
jgi:superoxide reductase